MHLTFLLSVVQFAAQTAHVNNADLFSSQALQGTFVDPDLNADWSTPIESIYPSLFMFLVIKVGWDLF